MQTQIDHVLAQQPAEFGLTLAVLVQQGGQVIAEGYNDTPDTPLTSWSMAKSFTHALVGIAVDQGLVPLHGPAPVPEWQDPEDPRHAISVDHLLKMHSGLLFNEDYVDDTTSHCIDMLFGTGKQDTAAYAASLPLEHPPGEVLHYSSGTTNILCRILADAVGKGPAFEAWMRNVLLDPIGIGPAQLTFDDAGTWVGSSFLKLPARDFARFGTLYLHDGKYDGKQVLPEGWVQHGVTPSGIDEEGSTYCAHWWRWPPNDNLWRASGYECQRILVWPEEDMVVVRLGKTPVELAPNVDAWLAQLIGANQ